MLGLWVCSLVAERNASTLGLESFLGGQAGEAGEIELAKIRIANLLAQKEELLAEARRREAEFREREADFVDANAPEVVELLAQIKALKDEIALLKAQKNEGKNDDRNEGENEPKEMKIIENYILE